MRILAVFVVATLQFATAQQTNSARTTGRSLAEILGFEAPRTGNMPGGWTGNPPETIFVDGEIVHGGRASARIERNADSAGNFTAISKVFDIDFSGKTPRTARV